MPKEFKTYESEIKLKREKSDFKRVKIRSSKDTADYARKFYHEDLSIYESLFIILLNNANNTIGYAKISQGGVTGTFVDSKIIAKYAIESLATSVIIVHNHPSGNLMPSDADKKTTEKVSNTLKIFDCTLLDHVILTEEDYYSFADFGLIIT